jgi:hypothetical protein
MPFLKQPSFRHRTAPGLLSFRGIPLTTLQTKGLIGVFGNLPGRRALPGMRRGMTKPILRDALLPQIRGATVFSFAPRRKIRTMAPMTLFPSRVTAGLPALPTPAPPGRGVKTVVDRHP